MSAEKIRTECGEWEGWMFLSSDQQDLRVMRFQGFSGQQGAEGCVEGAAAEHTHTGSSCDLQKAIVV